MAKFIFRLQGYLDLKAKLEDQKKLEYGAAMAELERERQILENLRVREQLQIAELKSNLLQNGFSALEIESYHRYLAQLRIRVFAQEKKAETAAALAEEKRLALVEAVRQRKTLEKLKEKAHDDFLQAERLAEYKATDEIVSYKYENLNQ
jgi:flagellar FliJ protein